MTKKEWILRWLLDFENRSSSVSLDSFVAKLKRSESLADLLDQKGYFDKPTEK